jgi:ABC-type glycerol-3-phosphate transport system substrate-binding protein
MYSMRRSTGSSKIIIMIIAAMSLLFFLASTSGCRLFSGEEEGTGQGLETEEESSETGEEFISSESITTLKLWDCLEPGERMALTGSRSRFMSEHGDIDIETRHFRSQEELQDQFEAASLAGAGPQLLLLDFEGVHRLAGSNVVREIVDEVDYTRVLNGLEEIAKYEGKSYIVPFRAYDFLALFFNRDIIGDAPDDFEGVFSYIQELEQSGEEEIYGFLLNESEGDWIIPFIGGYRGWIIDYDSNSLTLDSQAMQKTLQFLDYAYNQERLLQDGMEYGEINGLFKSGRAHMIIDQYRTAGEYIDSGINLGIAKIPRAWEGTGYPTPLISGLGFMININTYGEQLDAAKEFIDFMLGEETQQEWNKNTLTIPAVTGVGQEEFTAGQPLMENAFEQAKICRGKPDNRLIMVIRNAITDNVRSLLAGDITPEDAALKIQEDAIRLRSGAVPVEEQQPEGGKTDQESDGQ